MTSSHSSAARPGSLPSRLVRVRRKPYRACYDISAVHAVLDAAPFCHMATIRRGRPVVLPMAHGRLGNTLVLHGSPAPACSETPVPAARSVSPRPCSTAWCSPAQPATIR